MDKSDNKDQSKSQTAKTPKRYPCGTRFAFAVIALVVHGLKLITTIEQFKIRNYERDNKRSD